MAQQFLGIDIGGTKCSVSLGDEYGRPLDKRFFPTQEPAGPRQAIDNLFRCTEELLQQHAGEVAAIGISCGSPQDSERGIIQAPANLPSWKEVEIVRLFRERFGVPAFLENDANAGALAEFQFGAGKGCRHMLFMTFGTGMGAGLILNGQLYRGANGYAGELGHFRLADSGPVGCRKEGSFEGFCSGGGIAQLARYRLAKFQGPTLLGEQPSAKDVGEAAEQGDELAMEILETSGRYLGKGLALVLDLINPERVVIGSIFARCERFLRPAMERVLVEEALEQTRSCCQIIPAALGERIGDYAALAIAFTNTR